ncbi:PBSX family phage terminase large subunit [Pontibacter pamirensis]|uniref:PBSX family phage terminase large subunit n=1 Tax=Pontibacter pamirensis TaxID=2562824 RepID=UPI00138941EA|nr:PBSX family phage terminase large subunit [Pontibacter pamirensis]
MQEAQEPEIELQATQVFEQLYEAYSSNLYRVFVLEGGSRSSKTFSIIQFWLTYAQEQYDLDPGRVRRVAIGRLKATWITATVLFDFINVLKLYGLYDDKCFNKTNKIYKLYSTEFWFIGLDDTQKVHGFASDAFWINEAVESYKPDFDQLEQRCSGFAILDYNPSADEHWIYDNVCKRPDAKYIHSTMLDNYFLPANSRRKILSYEPTEANYAAGTADKNLWEIYGLGKRAKLEGVVYEKWEIVKELPAFVKTHKRRFGLDFGYTNDVTAVLDIYWSGNMVWIDELVYETHLLNTDIAKKLKEQKMLNVKGYADSAEPKSIEELRKMSLNIHPVKKGAGSVKNGIDILKRKKIHVTERSLNTIKELKNYKWQQDKNGKWLNQPIDDWNHSLDALRYVAMMEMDEGYSEEYLKQQQERAAYIRQLMP